jgi:hypothetical protein
MSCSADGAFSSGVDRFLLVRLNGAKTVERNLDLVLLNKGTYFLPVA